MIYFQTATTSHGIVSEDRNASALFSHWKKPRKKQSTNITENNAEGSSTMMSKIRRIFDETMDMLVIAFFTMLPLLLASIFLYGLFCLFARPACAEYIGRLSQNPFYADSCSNQFSTCGNRFDPDSPKNQFGPYGNPYSPYSTGPFGDGLRVYGDAAPDEGSVDSYAAEGGYQ